MAETNIRFATDILRRLGEELNPGSDQSILELVKNAYDADANSCTVEIHGADGPNGAVRVRDDGDGMSASDIQNGWLVLGRSGKASGKRTRLGRIPAGNKGLGRLAAMRMGKRVVLRTFPRNEPSIGYHVDIDWDEFDSAEIVEDVAIDITPTMRKPNVPAGTEIEIQGLRQRIGRMDVKRLARAMILLADPFGSDPAGFNPTLIAPEFKDLEALVHQRYFDQADYHLVASVDGSGYASAKVVDWRGETLFTAAHQDLAHERDGAPYGSPATEFDLWVFILSQSAFSVRPVSVEEVRNWLKEFGGVHLYENGLRVSPYGNPGNDWLDMNLRRVRSPEERPSTNTSIGRISVHDASRLLVQKTDRSGFIETEPFIELRAFAQDALDWMARRRLEIAEQRRQKEKRAAPRKSARSRDKVVRTIQQLPPETQSEVKEAFEAYDRAREREVQTLEKEVQLYRTLSTAGITAATFAHESSGNPIKIISQSIKAIERRAKKLLDGEYASLQKPIEGIQRAVDSLSVLGMATLRLLEFDKRRPGRVEIHSVLRMLLDTFRPFLDGRDVAVRLQLAPMEPYLRGSEAAVESIFTNLINNSLAAFETTEVPDRIISIKTEVNDQRLSIHFEDNGPGIQGIGLRDIWLPGQTTHKNGTGLGLAIVRDAVRDLGGEVDAAANGDLGGAQFTVELPILGVE
jgi:C4-dicarboxylate-specific signal transduction histidine kinase